MNHTSTPARKRRRIPLLSAAALIFALLLTGVSASALLLNLMGLRERQAEVRRLNAFLTVSAELHEAVRAAETGQRGYLLTDEARYLAPYEAAQPRVWQHLTAAERLVHEPGQASRIASLRPVIQAKLDELAETVSLRAQGLDAALHVVRSDRGQQLMEQIDSTMRSIRDRGIELVENNSAREQRAAVRSTIAAGSTGALALISAVLGVAVLLRQRAGERLFEAEARFRNLAENIPEVFWVSDPKTERMLYVSPAFEQVWGRSRQTLHDDGQSWHGAIAPQDRARVIESFAMHARQGRYEETYQIERPDGSSCWIRDRGWPVQDEEGAFLYVVGIAEDITPMRMAQDALAALNADLECRVEERTRALVEVNRELDAFAYSISHDLRAPLRAIQGYTEAVSEDYAEGLPPEGQHFLKRITASVLRMEDLIEDILIYSRLAQSEITVRPVSLEAAVDQVLADNAEAIADRKTTVQVERPLGTVQASAPVLRQALDNLVKNAIKFTCAGRAPRTVIRADGQDHRVRLWIEDDGIGIAPDHQERIFEPFQRLHGIESYTGTGIGLAIVRRALTRLGGTCGVVSVPGEGSRFWIELPGSNAGMSA